MNHCRHSLLWALAALPLISEASVTPTFDCTKVVAGSIEALICQNTELAELDQSMATVYQQASAKATNQHPPVLKAEQRGWIKGRNDCWKSDDQALCVRDSYRQRIAELQARYALVEGIGPVVYACDGVTSKEVIATFYSTEPATALVEFADSVSLMYQQPAASGSKYQGRNESLWEHQGEATVVWGYEAIPMKCKARQ